MGVKASEETGKGPGSGLEGQFASGLIRNQFGDFSVLHSLTLPQGVIFCVLVLNQRKWDCHSEGGFARGICFFSECRKQIPRSARNDKLSRPSVIIEDSHDSCLFRLIILATTSGRLSVR